VIVVDNASTDGTAAFVAQRFPQVEQVQAPSNLGFAGGNNLGWDHVCKTGTKLDYVALLNPDTVVTSGWLVPLVETLQQHPNSGAVQSKLMLHPQMDRINSAGNRSHFLGFGFTSAFGQHDHGQYDQVRSIDFASGAAMMVRAELLEQVDLFDDEMFMYLEDAELAWKLRLIGYDTLFVPGSIVYHKHNVESTFAQFYYLERNRWLLLLTCYRWRTLLLVLPAALVMELGILFYAVSRGMFIQKLRAWMYFLRPRHLTTLLAKRRAIQSSRAISDREFLTRLSGAIRYAPLDRGLLHAVVNPLLASYWSLAKRLIRW